MQFEKIRFDGKTVELDYSESTPGGSTIVVEERGTDPSPAFKAALRAFASYVVWVISGPESWAETLDVRGVTIKRPDDGEFGIIVTAIHPCPRARNGTHLINTPFLAAAPEGHEGLGSGFLPSHVPALVDELEMQATAFHDGEHGEQISLGLPASENTKAVNQRMADAEVASTRKPKGRKGKGKEHIPGVGTVINPDAVELIGDDALRMLLGMVDRDVPVDAIAAWTSSERSQAVTWARARQQELLGRFAQLSEEERAEMVPPEPACVQAAATLLLTAEEHWTTAPPPKASEVETVAVAGAETE